MAKRHSAHRDRIVVDARSAVSAVSVRSARRVARTRLAVKYAVRITMKFATKFATKFVRRATHLPDPTSRQQAKKVVNARVEAATVMAAIAANAVHVTMRHAKATAVAAEMAAVPTLAAWLSPLQRLVLAWLLWRRLQAAIQRQISPWSPNLLTLLLLKMKCQLPSSLKSSPCN